MAEFTRVTLLLGDQYPELDVCSNNGTSVRVFQWQPKGVLVLNHDRGLKCEDTQFIEKARSFIQIAREQHASLVLTPEYSFPYLVLDELVSNNTKWPEQGKLWCLGTQGESRELFNDIMMRWNTDSNIEVIDYAYSNNLGVESFVCPLIYLFLTRSGKLCIIPQFKTFAMADPRLFFEGPRLCRGQTIFVFESTVLECENVFFSLICADAIGINSTEILQSISKKSIILFNPQLNPDPRYVRMLALRDELINKRFYEVKILTLNWSANTQVESPAITFNKPWSAFYKRKSDKYLTDEGFRANKENNHKKGTGYALNGYVEIWFSHRHEHCKSFLIRKGDHGSLTRALTSGDEPKTEGCFSFDAVRSWVPDNDSCMSNIDQLFASYGAPTFPYPVCQKNSGNSSCDKCQICDFFFGSLLGHFEEGELKTNSELVQRLLVGSDYESDQERAKKLSLVIELKRILDAGNIPIELGYFINNYTFFVHNDFPGLGKQIVNLSPIQDPGHAYPEALVVITEMKREEDVEIILTGLIDRLSCNYRNQILIYYKPITGANFIYYDKHLNGTDIMQPSFDDNLALIMNPRTNMGRR